LVSGGVVSALIQKDPSAALGPVLILANKDIAAVSEAIQTGNWQPFIEGITSTAYVGPHESAALIAGGGVGSLYSGNVGSWVSGLVYVGGSDALAALHDTIKWATTGEFSPTIQTVLDMFTPTTTNPTQIGDAHTVLWK